MDWYFYPLIILAGFVSGFINTLAGSGSLVVLPLLIFIGLPATMANGTNRVGILMQNIVAINRFNKEGLLNKKAAAQLGIPAIFGGILGAQIAVNLDDATMNTVIGIIMILMLFVILLQPKKWMVGNPEKMGAPPTPLMSFIFFLIGIYGGFIQAGVGIFLLAGLVLGAGYDLVKGNAIKVTIILLFTIFALVVFVINDQVNWSLGVLLGLGTMAGAWAGTKVAVSQGPIWVRRLLISVVIISAAKLLGAFDAIESMF